MISFTVRMKFRPEDRESIAGFLRELTEASRAEPGCVSYIPHTVETDPDLVFIYEQYKDDAAAAAHRETPYFDRLRPTVSTRRCSSARSRCCQRWPDRLQLSVR